MLSMFKHLLPRARAWSLTKTTKTLRKFFEALAESLIDPVVSFFDLIWFDLFPSTTRELKQWELSFGFVDLNQTEQERRDRLSAFWKVQGGQDPTYIQTTLQEAGFDVYVYDWWQTPVVGFPTPINPYLLFGAEIYACGDPEMQCGEPIAQCGSQRSGAGYMLVNKLYNAYLGYNVLCADTLSQCGEPTAVCGDNDGIIVARIEYAIPPNSKDWPWICYISGNPLGTPVLIQDDRRDEFEDLVLQMVPAHLWIGMNIIYRSKVIVRSTGNGVIVRSTGNDVIRRT